MIDPANPGSEVLQFLADRHLATLTTLRSNGSPHVVAVGFSYTAADQIARVITSRTSVKARNASRGGRAAVCQIDGGRWLTLEGEVQLVTEESGVATAVEGYAARYRQPGESADRAAIEIRVDRILGRA